MAGLGVGDLAQSLSMRRRNAQLKAQLNQLGAENASGKAADLSRAVGGDHRATAALNRSLTQLAAYKTATTQAGLLADAAQTSVSTVQSLLESRYAATLSVASSTTTVTVTTAAQEARTAFAGAVAALNAQVGGRAVFSGTCTGTPLPSAEDLLAGITAAASGAATAADAIAAVADWFDAATGGYADSYQGAADPLAPMTIGAGEAVRLEVTALDPALKTTLQGFALASLAGVEPFASDLAMAGALLTGAGETMARAGVAMTALSARIGIVQARVETVATANAAETSSLKIALSGLTEVDPYDSATLLTSVESQQKVLYAVTTRLSALSLLDYL